MDTGCGDMVPIGRKCREGGIGKGRYESMLTMQPLGDSVFAHLIVLLSGNQKGISREFQPGLR
jgi:hypothetical protein